MTGYSKKGQKGFQKKEVLERRKKAAKEHNFSDEIKAGHDYISVMNEELVRAKLRPDNEKVDEWGLTDDFYKFIGIKKGGGRDYMIPLNDEVQEKMLETDFASYYTPLDNFYGTPGGGDTVYDQGRIPVSHLMVLCSQRLGVAFRGTNSVANDVFRNKFVFAEYDNIEKEIKKPKVLQWMRKSKFWDRMVECLDFERRTGLGHLVAYYPNEKGVDRIDRKAPKSRPYDFESFSCYYMTPNNLFDSTRLDYDKQKWNFTGGLVSQADIHHSRVYVLETRRVEAGLRGIAIPELCWVPLLCYLNTMYYILRSLSQLGTIVVGVNIAQEYPDTALAQKYLDVLKLMRANKFYLFGKNMKFQMINVASKIGEGINSYLEFLKEDISSAWIIPKNQLFGRSEGGGLAGAGALVSKEDYLASNLSTLQLNITNDIMWILQEMCGFPDLENITLRWNLDLHKTEQQRLTERLMREQIEQAKIQTKMVNIQKELMKIQHEQAKLQWEQFQKEPELLMPQTQEQPEKAEKKVNEDQEIKPKQTKTSGDFIYNQEIYSRWKFRMDMLSTFVSKLDQMNKTWRNEIQTVDERIKKQQERKKEKDLI